MATKKPTPFEQHPRADSSSDDEEDVSNEEDEEEEVSEESDEEEPKKPDPKPDSSSEEEDGSDSGTDEEVTPVVPVKPVEVQSPKVVAKSKQKQPAPATAPSSAMTVAKLGKKRPGESKADEKDSKKLKKVEDKRAAEEEVEKVGNDTKKPLFQRLFSEEDEIVMLNALLEYSAKKSIDPIEDFNDFHDFVKKSIHVDVTSAQLADKIRRLKKKYVKNASKTKEGVDKTFGKPHEQLCYDLSKKIWGKSASACGGSELKASGKGMRTPKPNMTPDQKEKHASSLQIPQVVKKEEPLHQNSSSLFCLSELAKTKDVGMMGLSDDILKKGFELLSDDARAALEDKWKKMAIAELELYYKRLELSREQVKLTLDALKASGHCG